MYLLLSVFSSTLIIIIFKLFGRWKIDTFQAIVFNYITCVITGSIVLGDWVILPEIIEQPYFPYAAALGVFFISGFYTVGRTVEFFGMTVATIAQKMSLLITILATYILFTESMTVLKVAGICLAFPAIVLSSWSSTSDSDDSDGSGFKWVYLVYTFIVSGIIEVLLKAVESLQSGSEDNLPFTIILFAMAGIIGTAILVGAVLSGKSKINVKSLGAGILLGIPNFFSIYFLLQVLSTDWEATFVYPVNNVAIVLSAALCAVLIFREKLSHLNILGLLLAILSIVCIAYSA